MNVASFPGTSMVPSGMPMYYGAGGMPFFYPPQQPQQNQQQPQYVMMPSTGAFPQPQQALMMMPGQAPTAPAQHQQLYFMAPNGAIYTTTANAFMQQAQAQQQQQQPSSYVPHTAYYVPQESTYVNGGRSQHNSNRSATLKGGNAGKTVEKKEKSDAPVNHDSLCRHFLQGRCNRRKCRFLHLSGEEAKAYIEAHPSAAVSTTATSQDGESALPKCAGSEKDESDGDNVVGFEQFGSAKAAHKPENGISFNTSTNSANTKADSPIGENDDMPVNGGMTLQAIDCGSNDGDAVVGENDTSKSAFTLGAFSETATTFVSSGVERQ